MSKKKKIVIIVCSIVAFIVLALSILSVWATQKIKSMNTVDENGNRVLSSDGYDTTFFDALPATLKYNDKQITLTNIEAWQDCIEYNYYLFVKATFDISDLSEAEQHWLLDEDFNCSAYVTCNTNHVDFERLKNTNSKHDKTTLTVSFSSMNWNDSMRHSFDNCEVRICADVKQEETYEYVNSEGKTSDLNKTVSFHCPKQFETVPFVSDSKE